MPVKKALFLFGATACPTFFAEVGNLAAQLDIAAVGHELFPIVASATAVIVVRLGALASFAARSLTIAAVSFVCAGAAAACRASVSALISIVAAYLAAFVGGAVQSAHHTLGVALGHLDIAELLQQINMSHLLVTMDMLVDKLHDLTRIEAVLLAKVDKQTAKPASA